MCDCRCYVVPPYLLRSISESKHNPQAVRTRARESLALQAKVNTCRHERTKALWRGRKGRARERVLLGRIRKSRETARSKIASVDLLRHIAESESAEDSVRERAKSDLDEITDVHKKFGLVPKGKGVAKHIKTVADTDELQETSEAGTFYRAVYDAENSGFEFTLPGTIARAEGEPATKDKAVNDAYDNVGHVLLMFKDFFDWTSVDNDNMQIVSTVHFGSNYENAYWDPDRMQLVFGDGDEFLKNFTGTVDVIGHELTHAVTDAMAPLLYFGQSGALNEHISDVFGIIVKQRKEKESAEEADWLIGEGCLVPGVKGIALRSMKDPGTAYDDPRFGKDPQPSHFEYYEDTFEDNGGVHIYSGIPNRAFYLAAVEFGGYSWQKAGKIWWDTLHNGMVDADCTFLDFAQATVETAKKSFNAEAATVVANAWKAVGVLSEKGGGTGWMDRVIDSCKPF